MREYKEKKVEVKQTYLDKTTCDICGKEIIEDCYEIDEVKIQYKKGVNYPEGGDYEKQFIDCCSECFKTKIRPLFKHDFNVEFQTEKANW